MPEALNFGPPIISVDVEDWPQSSWDNNLPISERAAINTRRILELLREANVSGTMFVLGKFAKAFPAVVREIYAEGHEIASHGYGHIEIFKQSRKEFYDDVRHSKDLLEDLIGESVKGYRAPNFSIVRSTLWALDVLVEAGFEYDSSIFPIQHSRYGIPEWPTSPVQVGLGQHGSIAEIPIATIRWRGKSWPVGGGGYHRLLPGIFSRYFARSIMRSEVFVFYCHPYELDPLEFREIQVQIPWPVRLHQGIGRRRTRPRLKAFLRQFGGRRMKDLLSSTDWASVRLQSLPGLATSCAELEPAAGISAPQCPRGSRDELENGRLTRSSDGIVHS